VGQFLIVIGLLTAAVGVLVWLGAPIGRLPGDVVWKRGGFTFYLPITTSILISVVLTVVAMFFRR
jgi:hypothetical protein